jgi:hypothetical protein
MAAVKREPLRGLGRLVFHIWNRKIIGNRSRKIGQKWKNASVCYKNVLTSKIFL